MLKKIFAMILIWVSALSSAFAISVYIAPSAIWDSYYAAPIRYEGWTGRLALGLGLPLQAPFSLAIEGWVIPIKPSTHTNNTFGIASLKPSYSYGASLLPGYILDDYLRVFIRLGGLGTKFDSLNETVAAWQAGAGIDVFLSCFSRWSVRGEWDYSRYRSTSSVGVISDGEYSAGIVYRFL